MATYRKRANGWRVEVCVNRQRDSKVLPTKREAQAWGVQRERELREGTHTPGQGKTFGDLLDKYMREVSVTKKGAAREKKFVLRLLKDADLASVPLPDLAPADIAAWRDRRLREVSGSTVQREMNILSHACSVARKEWGWLTSSPTSDVRRPKHNPARSRIPTTQETDRMLFSLGYEEPPFTKSARVGWAFLFALETAMRIGEIANLMWENVFEKYVYLPQTKNGHPRKVPLSSEATRLLGVIKAVTGGDEKVLGVSESSVDALWRKARNNALVDDLHFHDSRRAALTALSKTLTVMELAQVSGHRDLRILQNVYYAPDVNDLADKIG